MRKNVNENVTENVTEKRLVQLYNQIKSNNFISIDQLAEKLNVTRRTILRDIEKLKKNSKIQRIGPDKGGYWQIIEPD
ncbi:MAG: HTH domain-containing protein [Paludibacter sp.]|nr:HTH domain-containing protein [Paludibacter sp.]